MIIPIRTDSRLHGTPYMNWALIAVNVLVFCIFQHAGTVNGHWSFNLDAIDPQFTYRYELSPESPALKTFITYAFMHANIMHLAGNMLFLYIFGNNVNDKMGHLGYLAFYLAGGVAAGIAFVLMSPGGPVIGASGAIAAVTGGYLVLFLRSSITIFYMFWMFGTYDVPSIYFILFFFLKDLFLKFAPQDAGGVAYAAHIGGTIYGFAVCLTLLAIGLLPRDQFDLVAAIKQWNRRRQYRDMVSKGYNPFEYGARRPGAAPLPPDPKQEKIMALRASILDAITRHEGEKAIPQFLELLQLDPQQALPKQAQLDIANQLAGDQRYTEATAAYETYLRVYPKAEHPEQIFLMLGLIYARYLTQPEAARRNLEQALLHLHDQATIELAKEEIAKLPPADKLTR